MVPKNEKATGGENIVGTGEESVGETWGSLAVDLLRARIITIVETMGYIVVSPSLYDAACEALPEIADKIIKSERPKIS